MSLVAVALAQVTVTAGPASGAPLRKCATAEFASGALIVKGVSCSGATRILHRALAHPGCRPKEGYGRGCYGFTKVGAWHCSGLFPGEGFDLTCRSDGRRIHGSAGG